MNRLQAARFEDRSADAYRTSGTIARDVRTLANAIIERAELHYNALSYMPANFVARPNDFASYYAIQNDRAEYARRICFAAYVRGQICPNG